MSATQLSALAPDYYARFQCIGGACPDNCCYGWQVDLDRRTYEEYARIEERINGHIPGDVIQRRSESTIAAHDETDDSAFGSICLLCDGKCPFLDEQGLCAMVTRFDDSYLSRTCTMFPRKLKRIFGTMEASFSLACPVAAKIALSNSALTTFKIIPLDYINHQTAFVDTSFSRTGVGHQFEAIQRLCIEILQLRTLTIPDRLLVLGMFTQRLQYTLESVGEIGLVDTIERYHNMLSEPELEKLTNSVRVDGQYIAALAMTLVSISQDIHMKYPPLYKRVGAMAKAFNMHKATTASQLLNRYLVLKDTHIDSVLSQCDYVFENYLVNRLFHDAFPMNRSKPFDAFVDLGMSFGILKLFLLGCDPAQPMESAAIETVSLVSRAVEHSTKWRNAIAKFLGENQLNTMAYIATIIKG